MVVMVVVVGDGVQREESTIEFNSCLVNKYFNQHMANKHHISQTLVQEWGMKTNNRVEQS
jgi:hypothetical protein